MLDTVLQVENAGPPVKVSCDYSAVKEDEISLSKGETVQILATNQHNMYLVHRVATDSTPAAEGWVPAHVLGQKDDNR